MPINSKNEIAQPTCKSCKGQITQLLFTSASIETGHFNSHGKYVDIYSDGDPKVQFLCPHCGAHLFDNEDDAYDFLNCEGG